MLARVGEDRFALAFARIECHYFVTRAFSAATRSSSTTPRCCATSPGVIVQGRYDVVCPMDSAWRLHRAWPEAQLVVVPDAGHSANEPGITRALVDATDAFAR
jgi:proline iminopeptidase